jgi:hypothetical protein
LALTAAVGPTVAAGIAVGRVEHLHFVGDDLGGINVLSVLVLPLAGLDATLDVNFAALAQILAYHFGQAREEHNAVPFSAFLHFAAGFVPPRIRGGQIDVADCGTASGVARLGIGTKITD